MAREKSDHCTVPEKDGNASGGKAVTASEQARQLGLFSRKVDSPKGADGRADMDRSLSAKRAVRNLETKKGEVLPAMTMEEVASYENLKEAFKRNIYVRSERAGKRVMESISRFIVKRLRLKVNEEKSAVAKPEERHFVGFRLRRDPGSGEVEVKLSKRSKKRIDAKIRELTPRNFGKSLKKCIKGINVYLIGWIGFFRICTRDELRTLGGLDAHIRRRLRAIILKQWKRKRTIAKRLIKRGIRPKTAWSNVYKGKRSWWELSHTPAVDRALPNAYFADQGLVFLTTKWEEYRARTIANAPEQLCLSLG